jgi:hypothetical protein
LLHLALLQECRRGGLLPRNRAYLDNCSTVTVLLDKERIEGLGTADKALAVQCNKGTSKTKRVGKYGPLKAWHLPSGIANIFSQSELEKYFRVTYDSWEGFYLVHADSGPVRFYKDENGCPTSTWTTPRKRLRPCSSRRCGRTSSSTPRRRCCGPRRPDAGRPWSVVRATVISGAW